VTFFRGNDVSIIGGMIFNKLLGGPGGASAVPANELAGALGPR